MKPCSHSLVLSFVCLFISVSTARPLHGQDFGFDILGLQAEDFFQPPDVDNVRLSPDGSKVVYAQPTFDETRIRIFDIPFDKDEVIHEISNEDGPISYLDWLDGETILYQSQFGDLYTRKIDSSLSELVFGADRTLFYGWTLFRTNATLPRVISLLPSDPKHILISAFDNRGIRRVYKLPLKKWNIDTLPDPLYKSARGFDIWHADPQGEVRLAMKLSQRGTTLYHRIGNSKKWGQMSDMFDLQSQGLSIDVDKRNITQRRDYLLGFGQSPEQIYFASNRKTDTAAIYLFDTNKGQILKQVAHDPQYDLIDVTTGAARPILHPEDKRWLGIHYETDRPVTLWFEESYREIQDKIDSLLPETCNLVIEFSANQALAVVQALSSNSPARYHLFNTETESLQPIGEAKHPLAREPGVATQAITFQAQDGHTLHGYFTPAKDFDTSQPAPLVIVVHGGPWARDSYSYEPFTQCLANKGYSTLRINFRGSTGYGFEHMVAAEKNYGWAVQDDIRDGRQWAIDRNLASPSKIAIMGFSYGGYAAALAAAHQPDSFQCAVPMSGIYDILYETKQIKKEYGNGLGYQHWKQMVGSEWKDRQRLAEISPINLVDNIEIPILLAHGTLDPVAGIEHARTFAEALANASKAHEFIELEEEGHSLDLPKNQVYLFEKIDRFLSKHLK